MRMVRLTLLACALATGVLTPVTVRAQIPGVSSLIPDKATLLEQAKKLLAELTAMKQDPKLPATDKSKVDALIPQATNLNSELAKPQTEPSRLAQLAGQLGDLQKQLAVLKGGGK